MQMFRQTVTVEMMVRLMESRRRFDPLPAASRLMSEPGLDCFHIVVTLVHSSCSGSEPTQDQTPPQQSESSTAEVFSPASVLLGPDFRTSLFGLDQSRMSCCSPSLQSGSSRSISNVSWEELDSGLALPHGDSV